MTPESKITLKTMHELSAGLYKEGYETMRRHLAADAGRYALDGSVMEANRYESMTEEHERESCQFIRESVELLPAFVAGTNILANEPISYEPEMTLGNNPEKYLTLHGLVDRLIWLSGYTYRTKLGVTANIAPQPNYVIGANPKSGLLVCGAVRSPHAQVAPRALRVIEGRAARKAAKYYAQPLREPNRKAIADLYDPVTACFRIDSSHADARVFKMDAQVPKLTRIDDATLHEFNVLHHLMNLTALFDASNGWKTVVEKYTDDTPDEQVVALKQILAARFGVLGEDKTN